MTSVYPYQVDGIVGDSQTFDKAFTSTAPLSATGRYRIEFDAAPFKYDEGRLLQELGQYVASTYGQHYVGSNNVQAMDLIFSSGNGIGYCVGNVIKYPSRYGKKGGYNRADLMKTLHYALLLLYEHDQKHEGKVTG